MESWNDYKETFKRLSEHSNYSLETIAVLEDLLSYTKKLEDALNFHRRTQQNIFESDDSL